MLRRSLPFLAIALIASSCQTPRGEWRRANVRAQWLLTKLATLSARSNLRTDLSDELDRERTDLERMVRTTKSNIARAFDDGAYEDMRRAIARLDELGEAYDRLSEKYTEADVLR